MPHGTLFSKALLVDPAKEHLKNCMITIFDPNNGKMTKYDVPIQDFPEFKDKEFASEYSIFKLAAKELL
jgi:hypothetical protein